MVSCDGSGVIIIITRIPQHVPSMFMLMIIVIIIARIIIVIIKTSFVQRSFICFLGIMFYFPCPMIFVVVIIIIKTTLGMLSLILFQINTISHPFGQKSLTIMSKVRVLMLQFCCVFFI